MSMEKQGVIKDGITPPEKDEKKKDKQASDRPKTKEQRVTELEQDPVHRLSQKVK